VITSPEAVNSSGVAVGSFTFGGAFLYDGSSFSPLNFFGSDINDAGQILGSNANGIFINDHGTVTQLGHPFGASADYTVALSLNSSGQVAGFYLYRTPDFTLHQSGFIYTAGTYHKIDVPGAISTAVEDINDQGDVVGAYTDARHMTHGFIYTHDGQFITINAPASVSTTASDIADDGTIIVSAGGTNYIARPLDPTHAVWASGVDGNFDDAANWRGVGVPTETTGDVLFKTGSYTVTDNTDHTIANVTIGAGATLAVSADLEIHGALLGAGTLEVDAGGSVAVTETVSNTDVHLAGDGATFEFGNLLAKTSSITFDAGATGSVFAWHSQDFKASVSGMDDGDTFVFGNMQTGGRIILDYIEDQSGTGGTLKVVDARVAGASIHLVGDYSLSDFTVGDDGHGHVAITNHHLLV
jgi:probable HAF family extracellular repeat protein